MHSCLEDWYLLVVYFQGWVLWMLRNSFSKCFLWLVSIALSTCIEISLFQFDKRSFSGHTSLILLCMHMLWVGRGSAHWTLKCCWSNCVPATYAWGKSTTILNINHLGHLFLCAGWSFYSELSLLQPANRMEAGKFLGNMDEYGNMLGRHKVRSFK